MISFKINSKITSKNILYFSLIIIIQINQSFSKSVYINTNIEEEITISSLQGQCTLIPCGYSFCSKEGGVCEETTTGKSCKCKSDFTTPEEDEFYNCCYRQKSSLKAFFLEACLGFGAGHFYIGNKKLGIIKALTYAILFLLILSICLRKFYQKNRFSSDSNIIIKMCRSFCVLACMCTFIIWQMIDSVMFSLGGYSDDKGVNLS